MSFGFLAMTCFGFTFFGILIAGLVFFFAFLCFKTPALDLAFAFANNSAKTLASAVQSELKNAIANINIIFFISITWADSLSENGRLTA